MSSLVHQLRSAGRLHARGEFTLDVAKAGSKLSRFQFRDEREFLYQLVGGLYRLGAQSIGIAYSQDRLKLELAGMPIDEGVPQELDLALLEEFSPLRRLAAACQAILAHQPEEFLWVGVGQGQTYDYLTDSASKWTKVCLQEIRLNGLPKNLLDKALKELEKQALYNRRLLSINGRPVERRLSKSLTKVGGHAGWCLCDPSRIQPELRLVVDEMCTEAKSFPSPIPWSGVVYWQPPQIRLDASLASVVEDEVYQELLAQIPATYTQCVLGLIAESQRPVHRDFLLDLLRTPAPAWLHGIYAQLSGLDLFVDGQQHRWTLNQLRRGSRTIYHSTTAPPPDLSEVVLVEKSAAAVTCLQVHLQERLQEATPVVLRRLQREANQQRWSQQPQQGLQLPSQSWLLQRQQERWSIGLPDDWSQPGGTVTLVHQGKFLAKRQLKHTEITFHVVCELDESQISPLWNGISDEAWLELEPQWLYSLDELIKELSSGHELGPIRSYLLGYLARSKRPEDSYFAKTLLFQDWNGQLYSIYSLLCAQGAGQRVGTVASGRQPNDYPPEFLPAGVYLLAGPDESKCLSQVKALDLADFQLILDDLQQAQNARPPEPLLQDWTISWEEERYKACLEVLPSYGEGRIYVRASGVLLGVQTVLSEVGFVAHMQSEHLVVRTRQDKQRLGAERWAPSHNLVWKRFLEAAQEKTRESMRIRLESLHAGQWEAWARQGVLQGLAIQHPGLARVTCWQTYPERCSLQQLQAASAIYWSRQVLDSEARREFCSSHAGIGAGSELLFAPLNPAEQQQLKKWYGGGWQCVDDWFEQKGRLKEFLRQPPTRLGRVGSLEARPASSPLSGLISLVEDDRAFGTIEWLYQGRLVTSEEDPARPGLYAQIEFEAMEVNHDFTQVCAGPALQIARQQAGQQMSQVLAGWLAQPRPHHAPLARLWKQWDGLGGEVSRGLRRQPWFSTNQGPRSWDELLLVERIYRLPAPTSDVPVDLTVVYENRTPTRLIDQLMGRHPQALTVKASQKHISDRRRQEQLQARIHQQARRLQGQPYKVEILGSHPSAIAGEIALVAKPVRDCWLITSQRALPIHNLPPGWMGYLKEEEAKVRRVGNSEVAELNLALCKELYQQLLPAYVARIQAGGLQPGERENLAEYCLAALTLCNPHDPEPPWTDLATARWIPCADGTLVSLHQLRLECEEQQQLFYWPKKYALSNPGAELTPLLSSPLLLELVSRWVGRAPTPREKPLLHRDVSELAAPRLSSLRDVIQGISHWLRTRPGATLKQGLHKVISQTGQALHSGVQNLHEHQEKVVQKVRAKALEARQQAAQHRDVREQELQQMGKPLMAAVRRLASSLLQGMARKEALRRLERARWSSDSSRSLWTLDDDQITLYANHAGLRPWLGNHEPPPPVILSLLLGLVGAINARSEPFTDAMEREFLDRLTADVVQTYRDVIPRKEA